MDGTTAGNGPGPRTMIPVRQERDPGLRRPGGHRRGGGQADGLRPAVASATSASPTSAAWASATRATSRSSATPRSARENWGFTVGDNFASRVGDLLWFGPLKRLQKLFFHTPLVYLFVAGSYLYHDYVWYPIFGRRRLHEFVAHSPWGELFARYLGMSPLPPAP